LDGDIVQHIEYVPFGEVFIEERNNTWNTPYLFNAKELDEETGLYYYGARYYDPRISLWLSTDPLQEKYPHISSYAYCGNNPVRYNDPTGMFPVETIWDIGNVLYDIGAAVVNHIKGDHQAAKSNWVDLGLDAGAMLIPYVPAGVTKAVKVADKAVDAAKVVDKGTDAVKTMDKTIDATKSAKTFDGGASTSSKTSNEALGKAKEANGIPRSQQPDKTIKPNTPEGKAAGLDNRNVKQYEYTNSKGEKVTIRQDKPVSESSGKGTQPAHYNAGKEEKLKQHHTYGN
jgi:RHS repeat-associated protein